MWEREILTFTDEKYDPDDDSSDEEAIKIRMERELERKRQEALRLAEEEAKKP